jgi:hypothetical protein
VDLTAIAYAEEGARVAVSYANDAAAVERTLVRLRDSGCEPLAFPPRSLRAGVDRGVPDRSHGGVRRARDVLVAQRRPLACRRASPTCRRRRCDLDARPPHGGQGQLEPGVDFARSRDLCSSPRIRAKASASAPVVSGTGSRRLACLQTDDRSETPLPPASREVELVGSRPRRFEAPACAARPQGGREEAKELRRREIRPKLVLCSSSQRMQETLELIASSLGEPRVEVEEVLRGGKRRASGTSQR